MLKKSLFLILLFFSGYIHSQKISIPILESSVTDLTETLTKDELILLENKLETFEKDSIGQIAILLIPTTGEESIEEFSIRLAENWEIGSAESDDGVIFLVAKNDRKLRIEVGYGLESKITDANAGYIIEHIITPEFKNGDFYSGINDGVDAIISYIINEETVTISEIDDQYDESSEESYEFSAAWMLVSIFSMMISMTIPYFFFKRGILFYSILLIILTGANYYLGYHTGNKPIGIIYSIMSCFTIIIIIILKIVALIWAKKTGNKPADFFGKGSSSGSSSSWSSSSGSYGSSSSSYGGGSSYSGGGGSFGGGGASGSW